MGYVRPPFPNFETYLRIVVGLNEDDIQLVLKQYNSNFVIDELFPETYTIKDFSKAVYTLSEQEKSLETEYEDISMKIKLILKQFGGTFGMLGFDRKSFFITLLSFTPFWDSKPTNAHHADSHGIYISDKILNLSILYTNHLKCDIKQGSGMNGMRKPILLNFVLDKPSGYKIFSEPQTTLYKKIIKSVLNTIPFYLEDDIKKKLVLIKERRLLLYN